MRYQTFLKGERWLCANRLVFVLQGRVNLIAQPDSDPDFKEPRTHPVLNCYCAGDFVLDRSLHESWYFSVPSRTVLGFLDNTLLKKMLSAPEDRADFFSSIFHQQEENLLRLERRLANLNTLPAKQRILEAIKDAARFPRSMSHPDGILVIITRAELAAMAGCSSETAGRSVRELCEEGVLRTKNNGSRILLLRDDLRFSKSA